MASNRNFVTRTAAPDNWPFLQKRRKSCLQRWWHLGDLSFPETTSALYLLQNECWHAGMAPAKARASVRKIANQLWFSDARRDSTELAEVKRRGQIG
jgi:hypothetical protein